MSGAPIISTPTSTEERARLSLGTSAEPIYAMVARALDAVGALGGDLLDVGCGSGRLWSTVGRRFASYTGVDVVRYDGFPPEGRFILAEADAGALPLPDAAFDVVAAVETIEHLDGPRRFARELVRLLRPGGWLVVTTPNQLSLHSLLSLLLRGHFGAFAEAPGLYPAHITALLETDLLRIARELGLEAPRVFYSDRGRITLTPWHWPRPLKGRWFSDNLLLAARRPARPLDG
jgi:2-polyprenyl-3-methyl-5-hydroxy-6-metoxy-1,4-benzoquinol methylase